MVGGVGALITFLNLKYLLEISYHLLPPPPPTEDQNPQDRRRDTIWYRLLQKLNQFSGERKCPK